MLQYGGEAFPGKWFATGEVQVADAEVGKERVQVAQDLANVGFREGAGLRAEHFAVGAIPRAVPGHAHAQCAQVAVIAWHVGRSHSVSQAGGVAHGSAQGSGAHARKALAHPCSAWPCIFPGGVFPRWQDAKALGHGVVEGIVGVAAARPRLDGIGHVRNAVRIQAVAVGRHGDEVPAVIQRRDAP